VVCNGDEATRRVHGSQRDGRRPHRVIEAWPSRPMRWRKQGSSMFALNIPSQLRAHNSPARRTATRLARQRICNTPSTSTLRSAWALEPLSAAKRRPDRLHRRQARHPTRRVSGCERPVGKPTLINNVETYANIAPSSEWRKWFAHGLREEQGHQVFASPADRQHRLVEVPMASSCARSSRSSRRRADGHTFKAVQTRAFRRLHPPRCSTWRQLRRVVRLGSIMGSAA